MIKVYYANLRSPFLKSDSTLFILLEEWVGFWKEDSPFKEGERIRSWRLITEKSELQKGECKTGELLFWRMNKQRKKIILLASEELFTLFEGESIQKFIYSSKRMNGRVDVCSNKLVQPKYYFEYSFSNSMSSTVMTLHIFNTAFDFSKLLSQGINFKPSKSFKRTKIPVRDIKRLLQFLKKVKFPLIIVWRWWKSSSRISIGK